MINKEYRLSGTIGTDGRLYISDNRAYKDFLKEHSGKKVIIEVKVISRDVTEAMIGYYRKFVLPEFRKALMENGEYMTLEGTENFVTEITPMLRTETWCDHTKHWIVTTRKFEDLDTNTGVHCLEHLKQIAALEYGFDINEKEFMEK